MNFDLYMPVRLITGRGCVRANSEQFQRLGKSCMIVTSGSAAKKSGALQDVIAALESQGIGHILHEGVQQNPLLTDCHQAAKRAREHGVEFVVGIGGGSPLDAAKAIAVLTANEMDDPVDIYDYSKWVHPVLPLALVSTTAGTGSEVAPFSVLTRPDGRKASISHDQLYGRVSFGDAGYTDTLPYGFTVSTALDALSHALEAFFSIRGNVLSDLYAGEAVRILLPQLEALGKLGESEAIPSEMRDRLYYASVLAGFALAKCGTCYPHTLGYFLSEEHGVAHGYACAVYLPHFVTRAAGLLPDKTGELMTRAGCTLVGLCELIRALTRVPEVKLSSAEIEDLVQRTKDSKNFHHTAPQGFSEAEARELVTSLYAKA